MELKKYKVIIEDSSLAFAKRKIISEVLNDVDNNAINAIRFDISKDEINRETCLTCTTYALDEHVVEVRSFKTATPPNTVWQISNYKRPNFFQRLKLALKFIFKNDKEYFEQVSFEHKEEVKKLDDMINNLKSENNK